jgi:hypothetical protein
LLKGTCGEKIILNHLEGHQDLFRLEHERVIILPDVITGLEISETKDAKKVISEASST